MTDFTEIREAWTEIASGYDEHVTPSNVPIAETALQRAGLRPEMRMLDVAAGSGAFSIPAARAGAEVVATDISPGMVERLEARAKAEGLSNLEARVMDGHDLDFADDTFDIAGSQFGVMLFPDLPRGVRELARVTRPDGHVVLVTLGPPDTVEFLGFFLDAIKATVPDFEGLPRDPPPLPFQVADPERLREELEAARLRDVHVETTNHRLEFDSGAQLWDWVVSSNPIGAGLVADLTPAQEAAAKEELDEQLRERADGPGPAVLNNTVNIGIGTK